MAYNLTPIEKILIEPVKYYKEIKGKDIRKMLCQNLGEKLLIKQNDIDKIDDTKLSESAKTEHIAELERLFIENRKQSIRKKLKEFVGNFSIVSFFFKIV